MSSFIRDILPIAELERQDRLPGKYPTVVRMGDSSRRGDNSVFFDDTQTVVYNQSAITTFPTTFPVSSSYISDDLKSSISLLNGTVTKHGTDQFVVLRPQVESVTPFRENHVHVMDMTSDRFVSGTDVTDVGFGFSSKLRDKTIIRLELPIRATTRLVASGGYYYNFSTQTFDPVPTGSMPVQIGSTFYDQIFGQTGTGQTNEASPLLFSCLGTQIVRNYQRVMNQSGQIILLNRLNTVWNFDSSFSLLQSGAYNATGSIPATRFVPSNKSFVVEKATFEFPFSANTEWMRDSTQVYIIPDSFSAFYGVGGPAITVGVLNQVSPTRRDLIMSGTVVPQTDLTPWYSYKFDASAGATLNRVLNGFTVWSTPSAVVPGTSAFTGSVTMKMNAAVANGVTTWQRSTGGAVTMIASINPFGRSMFDASGRSVFGREFVQPQNVLTSTGSYLYDLPIDLPTATQRKLISFDQNAASPYLLRQNDNLVIYVATPRPALTASGVVLPYVGSVTASYNVSINAGTMYLTMYGSEITENTEFHDTLNQRLETNEIHEAVGFEPITDQFDVVYSQEFSGSNFSEFNVEKAVSYFAMGQTLRLSSSTETQRYYNHFDNVGDANPWSTQYGWSNAKRAYELKKSSRNIVLQSPDELFADCRLPDVLSVCKICNPNFRAAISFVAFSNPTNVIYTGLTSSFCDTGSETGRGIGDWVMSYPFEPKYSAVTKKFSNTFKSDVFPIQLALQTFGDVNYETFMMELGAPGRRALGTEYDAATTVGYGVTLPEFIKIFYGIGNGVSPVDNQHVTFRATDSNSYGQSVDIRGWRYGLYSGFPLVSTAVFRRDRFGQFRDMLEQRPDTKYVDVSSFGRSSLLQAPVTVKFVDSDGQITKPEYTFSSNLSTEVTSSVPFSDGIVRNREEPIVLGKLNQNVVVI